MRKAFTLIEISVVLIILGMIIATVFVVINRAVETVADWQTKIEAFEIARENMEKLLSQKSLSDIVEFGTSEKNPDIKWETTVESFYEPISNRMWMRAVCKSEYADSNGQEQKVELIHWLTSLSEKQISQVLEQKAREEQAQDIPDESDQQVDNEAELIKAFGPPPAGYDSWESVPPEQFWKAVKDKLGANES